LQKYPAMTPEERLKTCDLHLTAFRMEILRLLNKTNKPLTPKEIGEQITISHDRVTLYRTLKLFAEKGLLHRILVSDQLVTYRLADEKKSQQPDHMHFHCIRCDTVFCMPQFPVQECELPAGFTKTDSRFIVDGCCKDCNLKNHEPSHE